MKPKTPKLNEPERSALAELKETLAASLGHRLEGIVMFGSRARGDAGPDSDLDVAVLVRDLGTNERSKILDEIADIEYRNLACLSVLVLDARHFEDLRARERRIALDIEREGVPV